VGKTRKKKALEKLAGREKVFALSQFSGPDYLGAWNRLLLLLSSCVCIPKWPSFL